MNRTKKSLLLVGGVAVVCGVSLWLLAGQWMEEKVGPIADGSNDYAILLGAKVNGTTPSLSLQYRLEEALSYLEQHQHVTLVLAGGQGPDEATSEAEAMRRYLVERGIDESRLILEDQSTSTYENLKYAKKLIPDTVQSVTIITSDYHMARAQLLAKKTGWTSDGILAKTPEVVREGQERRERLALIKTFVVGQ